MPQGTIKRIVSERGFGFICPDDRSPDVFFHVADMRDPTGFNRLTVGDFVEYTLAEANPRPKAVDLHSM